MEEMMPPVMEKNEFDKGEKSNYLIVFGFFRLCGF